MIDSIFTMIEVIVEMHRGHFCNKILKQMAYIWDSWLSLSSHAFNKTTHKTRIFKYWYPTVLALISLIKNALIVNHCNKVCNARKLTSVRNAFEPPFSNNSQTIFECPFMHAHCKGVIPYTYREMQKYA